MRISLLAAVVVLSACPAPPPTEGEGEGDVVVGEGEGEVVVGEGEGDVVVGEGEGDVVGEGEGDVVVGEGEGEGEGCVTGPDLDVDADGLTPAQGDCDDCDARRSPKNAEFADGVDNDCDNIVDEVDDACDDGIALDTEDPTAFARVMGMCQSTVASGESATWGLVAARFVLADGATAPDDPGYRLGHGALEHFGVGNVPLEGARLAALSSGAARNPDEPGYSPRLDKELSGAFPQGFPLEPPTCPGVTTGPLADSAAIELQLRVPANAHSIVFNHQTFFSDFPGFVCSQFNDQFAAILSPPPPGQLNGDIARLPSRAPVGMSTGELQVCGCGGADGSCERAGLHYDCAQGDWRLAGTGFDTFPEDHGATGWLRSQAPVQPGSVISLRFAIWDAGDGGGDSTALVDGLAFSADEVAGPVATVVDAAPDTCGNGVVDTGELCDTATPTQTCAEFGFGSGGLICTSGCQLRTDLCLPVEVCGDHVDNNGDSLVDCDDARACSDDARCVDACFAPDAASGTFAVHTLGNSRALQSSCGPAGDADSATLFTAPRTARYRFTGFGFALSLRTTCGDAASEVACDATSAGIIRDLVAGDTLVVIAEGGDGGAVFIEELPDHEIFCSDLVDDDADLLIDCADDDCALSPLCP